MSKKASENTSFENSSKKKKRNPIASAFRFLLILVCLGVIAYCGWNIYKTLSDYNRSETTYDDMRDDTTEESSDNNGETAWYDLMRVDFDSLHAINEDVAGWLYFETNENINYPIMYSGDNDKYLRTTIRMEPAIAGSIFLDGRCTPDFSDYHLFIYGHKMKNHTMFGDLKYYKDEDGYWQDHQYFQILTENKIYRYQIFSWNDTDANNDIYEVCYDNGEAFRRILELARADAFTDTGISADTNDHVVTLSTCSATSDRFVVHAKRVAEYDMASGEVTELE